MTKTLRVAFSAVGASALAIASFASAATPVVVSPLLGLLQVTDPKTFLVTTGLIIEHGMLVNERVTRLFASGQPDAPIPAGGGGR